MPPKRMTANPARPARYRPGKPTAAEEPSSSEESGSEEEEEEERQQQQQKKSAPPPKASSFPKDASKITSNLKNVDLNARRQEAAAAEAARLEAEKAARAAAEEGFETEESSSEEDEDEEDGSESEEEESEEEEESSSSEDEAAARRKKMLRPVFVRKDQRKAQQAAAAAKTEDEKWAEDEARRKAKADALVQEQLEKAAAERAAGRKQWDDEDNLGDLDDIDDTDGVDPEAELAAWKLRELKRIKREREAIEEAEKEREEIERRRGLTQEERDAEDREFIERQKEERAGKGTMSTMQKYFHKGAFFQEDLRAAGLDRRDIMGSRYVDDVKNKDTLPEYMQIRDMTKLGKKGRTRYKDMRSEDTGRWGDFGDRRGKGGEFGKGMDDRFRPDSQMEGRAGATGANASAVGERKRFGEDRDERDGKRPRVAD